MLIPPTTRARQKRNRRRIRSSAAALTAAGLTIAAFGLWAPAASAATAIDLGTADSFSVLAGSTVTNTGTSSLWGDVGVSPGLTTPGLEASMVGGAILLGSSADGAKADLQTAYNTAAGLPGGTPVGGELGDVSRGGSPLLAGLYTATSSTGITGTLTLDAQGDAAAVWIFQIGSTLTTGSNSAVDLINGADACNVFWQVGSSATLGTSSSFVGTIMAQESITVTTGVTVEGRALALTSAVTLDSDVFVDPRCDDPDADTDAGDADVDVDVDAGDADADVDAGDADADVDAGDADADVDAGDADVDAGDADVDAGDADADVDADDADADVDAADADADVDAGDADVDAGDADADAGTDADVDAADADAGVDAGDADVDALDADADVAADADADADGAPQGDADADSDVDGVVSTTAVKTLPATGFDGLWIAPVGALLLLAGAALMLIRRTHTGS